MADVVRCAPEDGMEQAGSRWPLGALFVLFALYACLCSFAVARFPTEWDCANYCLGILAYDLHQHSPHPPGYVLYIAAGRALAWFTGDPHLALTLLSRAIGGLAVFPIYGLARLLLSRRSALWIAALSVLNPVSLFYGAVALSSIAGLLFGPAVVFLALRASAGSRSSLLLCALALGVAGGFRQDLLVFLAAPWGVALFLHPFSWRIRLGACACLSAAIAAWLIPMVALAGGLASYLEALGIVTAFATSESITLEGSVTGFLRNGIRFSAALIASVGLLGLVALVQRLRRSPSALARSDVRQRWVLAAWLIPPLLFFLLVFIHKPGYVLPVLPGLVLVAWSCVFTVGERGKRGRPLELSVGAASLVAGLLFFFLAPAVGRFALGQDGYLVSHQQLSMPLRVYRQFARVSRDEIRIQDEHVAEVNEMLAGILEQSGGGAIVTLPGNHFDFRVAMVEWPMTPVYNVDGELGKINSLLRGMESEFERIQPAPGQPVVLGSPGGVLIWVSTYNSDIGEELGRQGARALQGPRGSRLWVLQAGLLDMRWAPDAEP